MARGLLKESTQHPARLQHVFQLSAVCESTVRQALQVIYCFGRTRVFICLNRSLHSYYFVHTVTIPDSGE